MINPLLMKDEMCKLVREIKTINKSYEKMYLRDAE